MLSTGLRRPISRRFPTCSGPVPLSRFQSFPTPVSRADKSQTSRLHSFEHSLLLHATTAHAFRLRSLAQIMCRSPEALALGAAVISCRRRYHCPERGCLVNRSHDCTRSRVPPSFHAGVAITAPRRVPSFASLRALRASITYAKEGCAVAKTIFSENLRRHRR